MLIPVEPARFSYIGLRQLLARIESIRLRQNPRLRVLGIVASRVDVRTYHIRSPLPKASSFAVEHFLTT